MTQGRHLEFQALNLSFHLALVIECIWKMNQRGMSSLALSPQSLPFKRRAYFLWIFWSLLLYSIDFVKFLAQGRCNYFKETHQVMRKNIITSPQSLPWPFCPAWRPHLSHPSYCLPLSCLKLFHKPMWPSQKKPNSVIHSIPLLNSIALHRYTAICSSIHLLMNG